MISAPARGKLVFFFFFFFFKRDWVWKDPLEDSNSVTLPVSEGGGNQGWNGGGGGCCLSRG